MLEIRLLGQFQVNIEGQTVEIRLRSAQSLLAYLALQPGAPHRREKLAGLLWPDAAEANARNNLRYALWRLRQGLGADAPDAVPYLLTDDIHITLAADTNLWIDVQCLEGKARAGWSTDQLIEAVAVYQGELLPGFYEDWITLARERLQALYEQRMQQLLDRLQEDQRWRSVVEWSERWIALGSMPEPAYRALMVAHANLGNRGQLAAVYQRCEEALLRDLGVPPSFQTQSLFKRLATDEWRPANEVEYNEAEHPTVAAERLALVESERTPAPVSSATSAADIDQPTVPSPGEAPYKGLQFFDEADADLFFGRTTLVTKLAQRLTRLPFVSDATIQPLSTPSTVDEAPPDPPLQPPALTRFLAIVGASGSGKSSLVRAGLVPFLKPLQRDWVVRIITPTSHPLESLATSLTHATEPVATTVTLMEEMLHDARTLHLYVRRLLSDRSSGHLLLVVDQFEEIFTLCRNEVERRAFVDNLLTAAGIDVAALASRRASTEETSHLPLIMPGFASDDGPSSVVITVRADFYAQCGQYAALRAALSHHQEYIGPMSSAELQQAIEEPAQRNQWRFEPGLVDLLLRDLGNEPGALPLLSHALLETWQRRRGRTLTFAGYSEAGRVHGAIARTADTIYQQQLQAVQQPIARNIFLRLTELGEGVQDTRRRVTLSELLARPEEEPGVREVLSRLATARLITVAENTVEVAHEALIREWPLLRRWLDENREGLRIHRRLTEAAQEWERLSEDAGALYRGARLEQTLAWAAAHPTQLNQDEQHFLAKSQQVVQEEEAAKEAVRTRELAMERQRAAEQAQVALQLQRRALVLAILLLLALGATGWAINATRQATNAANAEAQQRQAAEQKVRNARAEYLANQALRSLDEGNSINDLALLLAREAVTTTWATDGYVTSSADLALRTAVEKTLWRKTLPADAHHGWIRGFAASPDGKIIATYGDDSIIRLWDRATGKRLRILQGHTNYVDNAAFSPNGQFLLTTGMDKTRLWDVITGVEISWYADLNSSSIWPTFSPDSRIVAIASDKQPIYLWEVMTGRKLHPLTGSEDVYFLTFSPTGKVALALDNDNTSIRRWDVASGQEIDKIGSVTTQLLDLIFSQDGKMIITASEDQIIRYWDATKGGITAQVPFDIGTNKLWSVKFSPDGRMLAISDIVNDSIVKISLWDIARGHVILQPKIDTMPGPVVSFTADSKALMALDMNGMIHNWNINSGEELQPLLVGYFAASFLPITSNSKQNFIPPPSPAFSPDGKMLLAASPDFTVKLWDIASGQEIYRFTGHSAPITAVGFSPDGKTIITASQDKTARLWDVNTEQEVRRLIGHTASVTAVTFSPDGKIVLTAGEDKTARLWNPDTGKTVRQLIGHTDALLSAGFSPDGKTVVTASADKTARLWDVVSGKELRSPIAHQNEIFSATFSPDGKTILLVDPKTVWLQDAITGGASPKFLLQNDYVTSAKFSPDGQLVALILGNEVRLINIITPKEMQKFKSEPNGIVAATFSPDGHYLAVIGNDFVARLLDIGSDMERYYKINFQDPILSANLSADGKWILVASVDSGLTGNCIVQVWDAITGQRLQKFIIPKPTKGGNQWIYPQRIAFSPTGHLFAVSWSDTPIVYLWDVVSGKELHKLIGHKPNVWKITFSSDDKRIVTVDEAARIWSVATAEKLYELPLQNVSAYAFNSTGNAFLTLTSDGLQRWNMDDDKQLPQSIAINDEIVDIAFARDNSLLLTMNQDGTIHLWDYANEKEVRRFAGHGEPPFYSAFSNDGKLLITQSEDGIILWNVTTGQKVRQLTDLAAGASISFSPGSKSILAVNLFTGEVHHWAANISDLLALAETRIERPVHQLTNSEQRQFGTPVPPSDGLAQ